MNRHQASFLTRRQDQLFDAQKALNRVNNLILSRPNSEAFDYYEKRQTEAQQQVDELQAEVNDLKTKFGLL